MMSQVLYWREARLCQPRKRKREKKKKTCSLHLVIANHALSARTSIFWSNQPDLTVTPNVNFLICHQKQRLNHNQRLGC